MKIRIGFHACLLVSIIGAVMIEVYNIINNHVMGIGFIYYWIPLLFWYFKCENFHEKQLNKDIRENE